MGEMDRVTKAYMSDNRIFADAVNFYFFGGKPHVDPDRLREMDPGQLAFFRQKNRSRSMERRRDVLKYMVGKWSEEGAILLFGIENQTQIDYSMPVRSMLYDALQYEQQVDEIISRRPADSGERLDQAEKKKLNGTSIKGSKDVIPRLREDDRLIPVTTLTIYYGADEWIGHRDLHSMLRLSPGMEELVENYRLNLICPAEIEDMDFDRFQTGLGKALKVCKYAKNAEKLKRVVDSDPAYQALDRDTANLIQTVLDRRIVIPEERREVDMCKAIDDLIAGGVAQGMEQGLKQGMTQGEEKKQKEMFERVLRMVQKNALTLVQAAECLGMSEEDFKAEAGL